MKIFTDKNNIIKLLSVIFAFAIWQIVSMKVGQSMLLASPVDVIKRLFELIREPEFLGTVAYSFGRISLGFIIAFVLGTIFGILAGKVSVIEAILWPYVTVIKTVPVASFIILCLIWFDMEYLSIIIAALISFPVIYTNVLTGMKSTDKKMKDMARIYDISSSKQFIYIYMPSVKPYILSAANVAIGMAWKSGVTAEVIGMTDGSIGDMLYQAKVYFQNAELLCWTLVIVLVSVIFEKLFVAFLKALFKGGEKL